MPTRIASEEELRLAAYMAAYPEICNDCGCRSLAGQPCGDCEADAQAREDMKLRSSLIPPVLRLPPYAHCTGSSFIPELPENAGRHAAPRVESDAMETLGDLTLLRSLGGRGSHCLF